MNCEKETRKNVLNVVKTNAEIKLVEEIYQNNPLKYWRNKKRIFKIYKALFSP
jgi:hypothetical protein